MVRSSLPVVTNENLVTIIARRELTSKSLPECYTEISSLEVLILAHLALEEDSNDFLDILHFIGDLNLSLADLRLHLNNLSSI